MRYPEPSPLVALAIATFSLQRGYTPEQADQIMEAFMVTKISATPSELMQILVDIAVRLGLEPDDEWPFPTPSPAPMICGAQNPRTGMICNVPPHPMRKHWTITEDGQRFDWYMEP